MSMKLIRLALAALFLFHLSLLRAADVTAPAVLSVSPAAGGTVSNLTKVTVTFTPTGGTPNAQAKIVRLVKR